MGKAIDATGIQFKLLNRSRGPAVWSPRAQADKRAYSHWVDAALSDEPNITWILGKAGRLLTSAGHITGLAMEDGTTHAARAIVVTTGTFLNGLIHIGREQHPAGRHGEPPSHELAESVRAFGFEMGRLKTGTPPRLDRRSIDFEDGVARGYFVKEDGDASPVAFSFSTARRLENTISCWLLYTNDRVRDLVRGAINQSPLFNGQIQGIGPRYCPSLEDKIMRFPDRERHQIYLEPEGVDVDEIYVNGFFDVATARGPGGAGPCAPRPRDSASASTWLRRGIRFRATDRIILIARSAPAGRAVLGLVRSTAHLGTRRQRLKASSLGLTLYAP
jgi:tRNA uridine 5-carboxymethylaminomethyl modification enzyme